MVRRLVVEPVWAGLQLSLSGVLADIGSGNGSPAIPLHVVSQLKKTHLIEARVKRAAFLRHLATSLQLTRLMVHRGRFDAVAPNIGVVDWITLQGVGLNMQMIEAMRQISSQTTTIVWITSTGKPGHEPRRSLEIPISGHRVLLFQLDQF
jgi:16S rRNA G527 N7-methylase RsmG